MFFAISKIAFLVLRPSNAVILAVLFGLLLRRFRWPKTGAVLVALGLAGMVAAGWLGLSMLLLKPLEARFPAILTVEAPPTGVIILGGVIDTTASSVRGRPELIESADRIVVAARLARQFPQARIIFTGGSASFLPNELPEADLAAELLETFGIALERIELERASRNTHENAVLTRAVVDPQPDESWLLVTSAYHMPRAMGVFEAAGWRNVTAYPVDYRVISDLPVLGRQFASEGLFLTDIAVKEWIGLVAYRLAGYTNEVFPAP